MDTLKETLRLTPLQLEILNDRLELDDCLVDVICDDGICQPRDVRVVSWTLASGNLYAAMKYSESITNAVLVDAVEGSTYYISGQPGRDALQNYNVARSGEALGRKVAQFVGCERVEFPVW